MTTTRCLRCNGAGNYLGMGMTPVDCGDCSGSGKVFQKKDVADIKTSDGYLSAKSRLKASNPDLTDDEADELLEEAFEKEKPKKSRAKQ